ncbi:hypothetical protein ACOSQ3_019456 [Xanthoceras sorbifolium]
MPTYVKFLKEIISNKRRFEDFETVTLTEECSAIILNKLSPKLKDPGSFTIPCTIGNTKFGNALCDLGASINLMPFSVFSGQQEKKSSVEDLISTFMLKQDALMSKMDTRMDVQESTLKQLGQAVQQSQVAIQILEVQVGQLARSSQSRAQGALPSNIETNLKEHCMALTLRIQEKEKEMSNVKPNGDNSFSTKDKEEEKEKEINKEDNLAETSFDLPPSPDVMAYVPPIPYPQRLKKYKDEKSFKKFLEVFKKLHINIHFAKNLAPMPTYVKFLKESISNKRRFEDFETVTLTEECSAIILNKLSPKLKDPGSFTIPCTIGNTKFGNALCDLGASINLMPFSVFSGQQEKKSSVEDLISTFMLK